MVNFVFLSEKIVVSKSASGKPRYDVERILCDCKGQPLKCQIIREANTFREKIRKYLKLKKVCNNIKRLRREIVVCQHPYSNQYKFGLQKALLQATENNKIIYLVHDVEFIRAFETEEKKKHEIEILNSASVIISHNQFMTEELKRNGVTNPKFVNLEIFDYLLDDIPNNIHNYGRSVVYAGNLAKAPFLEELEKTKLGFDLILYGINYTELNNSEIKYMGARSPEELVSELTQSFGLIWDSETVDGCTGHIGEYTRYNNPHKLSLYLVAGMPVIVWAESAIAKFVIENKVGFTINSLNEISKRLDSLTQAEYGEYVKNANALKEKLSKGYFMKKAIMQAIDICKE